MKWQSMIEINPPGEVVFAYVLDADRRESNPEGLQKFTIRVFAGGAMKNNERGPRLLKTASEY